MVQISSFNMDNQSLEFHPQTVTNSSTEKETGQSLFTLLLISALASNVKNSII